jgi:hypothetical protein
MGLALDEPREEDDKLEVKGLTFVVAKDVSDALQYYGDVSIDYQDKPFFMKGFRLSLSRAGSCT